MPAKAALGVALAALVLLLVTGPGYRVGVWPLQAAFSILRWAAYAGLLAVVLAILALVVHAPRAWQSVLALAIGAAVVFIPLQWQRTAASVPRIHDITTDTKNPPAFVAIVPLRANAPNTLEYSPDVARQQEQGYPDIKPLLLDIPPAQAFERALQRARDAGWEIVASDQNAGRIEATDTTIWFGFKDDIVVRLTPAGERTVIDVRSVSRIGRSDVGTNARRIRKYLESMRS